MITKPNLIKIFDLFLVSFITLYFEILLIRWIPSSVQIVAFFANILLISAFLGLGIGCLLAEKKVNLMNFFPLLLFGYVVLLLGYNNISLDARFITTEHFLGRYSGGVNFLIMIAIIFVFNTALFVPLGQKLGVCLKYFRPLVAYSINILGSIIGVAVFSYMSYLMLKPFHWFFIGLVITLWFYRSSIKYFLFCSFFLLMTLLIILQMNPNSYWSPYYKIDIVGIRSNDLTKTQKIKNFAISANDIFHQRAMDLSDESVAESPELSHYKEIYEFPYKLFTPKSTLILGAGSGNDAAAAIRMKSQDIYAVEIDPFIAHLGMMLHPEKPYLSEKVHVSIGDARSFIKKTDKKFDLITFGYLDAHRVLSQFSSVRLDNFIYTKESFEDIKEHLSPEGVLSLTHLVFREWVTAKLYVALKEVFGEDMRVLRTATYNKDDTAIFLAGKGVKNIKDINEPNFKIYNQFDKNAQFITDDWPYLYLSKRGIPTHYLVIILFSIIFACVCIFNIESPPLHSFNLHFFFLGAGFLLLEAVSITRFALLFGSTWTVNSTVIMSILAMILFSTLWVEKIKKINIKVVYVLLFLSLTLNWFLDPDFYLMFNRPVGITLSSIVLSLPILFASIIFAVSFKKAIRVPSIFAYNLLGAIAGGFCEYFSMLSGFRFLFILAIIMYYFSYLGLKMNLKTQGLR